MMSFWEERAQQVVSGHRIIFMAIASASGGTESASGEVTSDGTEYLAGVIELGMPEADSGPFRGDVEMLMVSSKHRNQGIGKKLIYELERTALERGRTLLQLATMADTVADAHFYPKLGYVKFGTVPNYGIEPVTMRLVDGAYFYKDLARPST
ncbi:hypothetical protein QQS21_002245 [Conoideocrella luteorostrata]|uniref:N-acetyltransferase domain-containing protein n=1 Tax=Conoideocrella luteorostrata TaxID=1105319 RepID=A0AAJ0CYH8_9HYPO|nr:hypothetical protein QQS21_002245 [Conoideocrella luteorostrata]